MGSTFKSELAHKLDFCLSILVLWGPKCMALVDGSPLSPIVWDFKTWHLILKLLNRTFRISPAEAVIVTTRVIVTNQSHCEPPFPRNDKMSKCESSECKSHCGCPQASSLGPMQKFWWVCKCSAFAKHWCLADFRIFAALSWHWLCRLCLWFFIKVKVKNSHCDPQMITWIILVGQSSFWTTRRLRCGTFIFSVLCMPMHSVETDELHPQWWCAPEWCTIFQFMKFLKFQHLIHCHWTSTSHVSWLLIHFTPMPHSILVALAHAMPTRVTMTFTDFSPSLTHQNVIKLVSKCAKFQQNPLIFDQDATSQSLSDTSHFCRCCAQPLLWFVLPHHSASHDNTNWIKSHHSSSFGAECLKSQPFLERAKHGISLIITIHQSNHFTHVGQMTNVVLQFGFVSGARCLFCSWGYIWSAFGPCCMFDSQVSHAAACFAHVSRVCRVQLVWFLLCTLGHARTLLWDSPQTQTICCFPILQNKEWQMAAKKTFAAALTEHFCPAFVSTHTLGQCWWSLVPWCPGRKNTIHRKKKRRVERQRPVANGFVNQQGTKEKTTCDSTPESRTEMRNFFLFLGIGLWCRGHTHRIPTTLLQQRKYKAHQTKNERGDKGKKEPIVVLPREKMRHSFLPPSLQQHENVVSPTPEIFTIRSLHGKNTIAQFKNKILLLQNDIYHPFPWVSFLAWCVQGPDAPIRNGEIPLVLSTRETTRMMMMMMMMITINSIRGWKLTPVVDDVPIVCSAYEY